MSMQTRQRRRAAVAATRRPRGRIRFAAAHRRRTSRPALVLTRALELCLLVGIVVALAASVVRAH